MSDPEEKRPSVRLEVELPADEESVRRRSSRRPSLTAVNIAQLDLDQVEAQRQESDQNCVIHPFSATRYYWDVFLILFMTYTAVALPLQFAFDINDASLLIIDQVTNLVFIIDLLLNFRTGYLDVKERTIVLDPRLISIQYLRTWFICDLVAATPFDLISLGCGNTCKEDVGLQWVFKWLRLLRMSRLLRLSRILSRLRVLSGLKHTTVMTFNFVGVGLFVAHVAASFWYAIGANGGTWVSVKDPDNTWTGTDAYVAALYWACTTMSTIGYGDIVAGSTPERLFACIVMTLGSCIYAYGITSVIATLSGVHEHERRLMSRKDQLNRYCSTMSVPEDLRKKLREYFVHYQNAADAFNERVVLEMLSPGLRASLCSLANAPLLRRVSFFEDVDEACVNEMAQLLVPNLFVPDEIIIMKGSVGYMMYVIKNGSVSVYLDFGEARKELAVLCVGQFFGEGALLKGKSAHRTAWVSAITYALIYSLHVDAMNSILPRFPSVYAKIHRIAQDREDERLRMSVRNYGVERIASPLSSVQEDGSSSRETAPNSAHSPRSSKDKRVRELTKWLASLGLESYVQKFVERGYDGLISIGVMSPDDLQLLITQVEMLPGHAGILQRAYETRPMQGAITHAGVLDA
jgi:hyperpolarization activated cyclic nucleotide-gated potassium channel 1